MFTGIIEQTAIVNTLEHKQNNLEISLACPIAHELRVDQSVSHNGVCLTVTDIDIKHNVYKVTAVKETLLRTNLGLLRIGNKVNIERCLKLNSLLDGHLVQGHVDTVGRCTKVEELGGSYYFHFEYEPTDKSGYVTVEKGSVTVNGVSLTVVNSMENAFSVAIIPYTFEHTNFKQLMVNDIVNIEFDIIGKYIAKLMLQRK